MTIAPQKNHSQNATSLKKKKWGLAKQRLRRKKLKVKVRVPATAANLGAGFNCLGLALELYNTLEISEANSGISIKILGEGKNELPKNRSNLSLKAIYKVFDICGYKPKGLKIKIRNRIPKIGRAHV